MAPTKPEVKPGEKPAPKTGRPAPRKPGLRKHDGEKSQSSKPGSRKPQSGRPGARKPMSGRPGARKPMSGRPGTRKPMSGRPGVRRPLGAKFGARRPLGTKSAPGKPGARRPLGAKSAIRKPGARNPYWSRSATSKPGFRKTRMPLFGRQRMPLFGRQRMPLFGRPRRPFFGRSGKLGKPYSRKPRDLKPEAKALAKLKIVKNGRVVKRLKPRRFKIGRPRNYDLGNGVYRFSRTRMYHKKAKYKFIRRNHQKALKPLKPTSIVKPIGGDNNGGTRTVLLKKRRNYYATTDKINSHPAKKRFSQHKRYIRKTLHPGKICILLAGRHKGKRVVLVKILDSGLLLVTGPMKLNGCPLRRISQNYVIATRTKLNLNSLKLPKRLNDEYFKRVKPKRQKKEEGDIFATKKEKEKVSGKRKLDQKTVDKQIMMAIKKHPDKAMIVRYLSAMFGLKKTQYPHRLIF